MTAVAAGGFALLQLCCRVAPAAAQCSRMPHTPSICHLLSCRTVSILAPFIAHSRCSVLHAHLLPSCPALSLRMHGHPSWLCGCPHLHSKAQHGVRHEHPDPRHPCDVMQLTCCTLCSHDQTSAMQTKQADLLQDCINLPVRGSMCPAASPMMTR